MNTMKKMGLAVLLVLLAIGLSGCDAVERALQQAGDAIEASQLDTPDNNGGDIDWSFVPQVREMATTIFNSSVPDATITETSVASRNGEKDRVIVTLTYELNGMTGKYGFDYELNEYGEYELKRYGEGVSSSDL